MFWIYVILIGYLAFTFWGSLVGVKGSGNSPEAYFLANRNLRTLALFFTILATNFSAFYFLGFAGEGYRIGYSYYFIMAFGTAFAALSFFVLGTKTWRLGKEEGYITPGELIYGQTQSAGLRYLFSGVMIVFTLPYLALQIIGGGYILENLTAGQISYPVAITLLTVFTIIYVLIGGMQSVAKTDLKQGLLAVLLMLLAVVFITKDLGGMGQANRDVFAKVPELFEIEGRGGHYTPKRWFSLLIFWFFCIPMFPQLFMRFYIAKDLPTLKRSALLYAFIPLIISLFPVIIGVLGHLTFPDLTGKEADQILPKMLLEYTQPWFGALIMTGALAAFMSTLDSQLLALSTMLTRDFYLPLSGRKVSFEQEVRIGRILVGVIAGVGLLIAFQPFDTIFDMGKIAFSGLAVLFPVALAVIRLGGLKPAFGIAGIVLGEALLLGLYYGWVDPKWQGGFEIFMPVILLSFLVTVVGVVFRN